MKSYTVTFTKSVTVVIEASDYDNAEEIAEEMCDQADFPMVPDTGWSVEDIDGPDDDDDDDDN